ncbi:C2H2-type zinc finger protein [Candidatus Bathyarchaeota archaeon]|nr:C2H2-type zinc finger protein [Candidatus Bathyarchaeota archaeon]
MALEDVKFLGIVDQVGLERDETEFRNFNLTVGIKVKTDKKLTFLEGERLIKQLKKELLGKNIELGAIAIPCPVCGKTFNTEQGMKLHVRRQHEGEPEPPEEKPEVQPAKKKRRAKKSGAKKAAKK